MYRVEESSYSSTCCVHSAVYTNNTKHDDTKEDNLVRNVFFLFACAYLSLFMKIKRVLLYAYIHTSHTCPQSMSSSLLEVAGRDSCVCVFLGMMVVGFFCPQNTAGELCHPHHDKTTAFSRRVVAWIFSLFAGICNNYPGKSTAACLLLQYGCIHMFAAHVVVHVGSSRGRLVCVSGCGGRGFLLLKNHGGSICICHQHDHKTTAFEGFGWIISCCVVDL